MVRCRTKCVLKQLGDDSCNGNRPVVPSITYVPILVFTNRYNDSLHGFPVEFFHPLNTHSIYYLNGCTHLNQHRKCAARSNGSLYIRDLIIKLLHINSSIPSKLPCENCFIFTLFQTALTLQQDNLWVFRCHSPTFIFC